MYKRDKEREQLTRELEQSITPLVAGVLRLSQWNFYGNYVFSKDSDSELLDLVLDIDREVKILYALDRDIDKYKEKKRKREKNENYNN